jgi:hypothetical protein
VRVLLTFILVLPSWTDPSSAAYRQREGDDSHAIMYDFYDGVFGNETKRAFHGAVRHMANEAEHVAPLMQPSAGTPLAQERARRAALEAELARARALIGSTQRTVQVALFYDDDCQHRVGSRPLGCTQLSESTAVLYRYDRSSRQALRRFHYDR